MRQAASAVNCWSTPASATGSSFDVIGVPCDLGPPPPNVVEVPTLGQWGLGALAAMLAIAGFLVGLCIATTFVLTETLLQEGTDLRQLGRVFSLRDIVMRLGFQITIWIAALLTPLVGTSVTLIVAAGVVAAAGALSMAWGRRAPELMRSDAAS